MDDSLNEIYIRDMKIIKKEIVPFLEALEENKVDMFSTVMFLASYVSELLKQIDDKDKKELILRRMLDGIKYEI